MKLKYLLSAVLVLSVIFALPASGAPLSDEDFIAVCSKGVEQDIINAINDGANVNAKAKSGGATPLILAVSGGRTEVINALIKAGANVNAVTLYGGETVLMTAAEKTKYPEVINALIDAGADVKATNISGQNALDYALRNENLKGSEVLKRLEELSK